MRSILLLDPAAKIFSLRERLLYFSIAAFLISLFLKDMPVINNVLIGALFLVSLIYNSFPEKVQLLKQRREIQLMILLFIWHIVSGIFSHNRHEALVMLALRAPLLIFPLSIGLIYVREELKDRILLAFIIIITLTAAVCMIYSFGQYRRHDGDAVFLYNDNLTSLIGVQSIYFALIVNLVLFSYFYLLRKGSFAIEYIGLAYLSIAFLLVFHFLLASRIAIISLYSVLLVFGIRYIVQRKNYLQGISLIMGLVIGAILLFKLFPQTLNRFDELHYSDYQFNSHAVERHINNELTADQWNGANIRLAVWKCAGELIAKTWPTGAQIGDKQDRLMDIYREKQFDLALATKRNTHSCYIDVLCTFGVFGFIVYVLGYVILPLAKAVKGRDLLGALIVGFLAISMITESYMDRSMGCLTLGFFLSFIASWRRNSAVARPSALRP